MGKLGDFQAQLFGYLDWWECCSESSKRDKGHALFGAYRTNKEEIL